MAGNITGRTLNNRYLIGERIGLGGMAEVYQGQDSVLGRTVAVKVMLPQYAEDPAFTARFRQEAASAANLQSPYIVNVYDWGQDNKTSFIVMEYVRGSDLKTAITQRGAINQRKVAEIGSQVCQALSVAHGLDIIHRDIKPQNIMVQPDGNVKVMDFGIARAKNSVMQKTDAVLGTAHYISPEQAQGKDLTAASDIYSLGVVLYEASTGQLPFDGPDAVSVAMKQVNDEPVPPREINPNIDPNLEAIIMKAMSKNPKDRFATARDMRHCLNDFLAGRPVNVGGFSGAQTAVIAEPIGPDTPVAPVNNGFKTGQTAVLNAADGNGGDPKDGTGQRNYIDSNQGKGGKGKRAALVVIGVIVAIAAIAALSYALLGQGLAGNAGVEVPDLAGQTLTEATSAIEEAGFKLGNVTYESSDTVEKDRVISQTPRAGTHQEQGSEITLTVSGGVEQITVPDLSNMTASEAREALQKLGLKYEAGAAEHSDTVAENHVLRQQPAAGTIVSKGDKVTYYLSAGEDQVTVPDVTGSYEGAAESQLSNAGFDVTVDYASSSTVGKGMVISQSPSGGEKAKSGSSVNIVVSTGAETFMATSYVGGSGGGSISPQSTQVKQGGSVTFYITPNTGYEIVRVVDSNGQSYGTSSTVTIYDIQGDVNLSAEFQAVQQSNNTGNTNTNTNTNTGGGSTDTGNTGTSTGGGSTDTETSTNGGTSTGATTGSSGAAATATTG